MINMERQLYFDISSEETGGSLYRINSKDGHTFIYHYSLFDDKTADVKVFQASYPDFESFWSKLTSDREWFYQHPLFVHPERRDFVKGELAHVDWGIKPDKKWQESHQRQWKKVLNDPDDYYTTPAV